MKNIMSHGWVVRFHKDFLGEFGDRSVAGNVTAKEPRIARELKFLRKMKLHGSSFIVFSAVIPFS